MSQPMTEARLGEIEARARASTPGPWHASEDGGWSFGGPGVDRPGPGGVMAPELSCTWVETQAVDEDGEPFEICRVRTNPKQFGLPEAHANAAFMASARADVPDLCAEVRRLRIELARYRPEDAPPDAQEQLFTPGGAS